jgi:hypothetical protein
MNQLVVHRNEVPALTVVASRTPAALLASGEKKAKELTETALAEELLTCLSQAAALLGHRNTLAEAKDLFLLATNAARMIQRRFVGFNLAEIREAIERGASGDYRTDPTQVLLVSLPSIGDWLTGYQRAGRAAAVLAAQAPAPAPPPPPRDFIADILALCKLAEEGRLPDYEKLDGELYQWLKERRQFTNFRPADYYADMRAEEAEHIMRRPLSTSWLARRGQVSFREACKEGRWPQEHKLAEEVNRACRQRLLHEWLLQQAVEEIDVAALLAPFA